MYIIKIKEETGLSKAEIRNFIEEKVENKGISELRAIFILAKGSAVSLDKVLQKYNTYLYKS